MDFDSKLLDFQRKINSLLGQLGSDAHGPVPTDKLKTVLEKWNVAIRKADEAAKRKIHLYLVLNSDLLDLGPEVSEDFAHVAGTAAKLSSELLVGLVRGCGLLPFAFETIEFCDPLLATQYFQILLKHNADLSVLETLHEHFELLRCLFGLLCSYKEVPHVSGRAQQLILESLDAMPNVLLKKLEGRDENAAVLAGGVMALRFIELVESCVQAMQKAPLDESGFYSRQVLLGFEYGQWPKAEEASETCFERIVEECENNMKTVDLDVWMKWEELDGSRPGKSLQTEIGEAAYRCVELERDANPKLMGLIAVLMGFKQKPVREVEAATLEGIISALEDDEKASKDWLLALLSKENILDDEAAQALVEKRSKLMDSEVVETLLEAAVKCKPSPKVAYLALIAFKSQGLKDQKHLLKVHLRNSGVGDQFRLDDFDTQVTTVLNRSASLQSMREKWLPQLLALCLQSPKDLLERAVKSGVASRGQGSLIASALSELSFLCSTPFKDSTLLLNALQSSIGDIQPSTSHLSHLVLQLEEQKLLKAADFIRFCLLPALKVDLSEYKIPHLFLWIQLLKCLLRIDAPHQVNLEGKVSLAVLLAVLAEILQRASWVLGKFRNAESLLRAETVQLVRPLACKYANSISNPQDKELLWLRTGLLRLTSHNRAHFGAIWTHFGLPVPSMNMGSLLLSREAMHQRSGMPPGGADQLLSPLLILLPSCCTPEWRLLSCSLAKVLSTYNTTPQGEGDAVDEFKYMPEAIRLLVTALMLQALMLSQQQPPDDSNYSNDCAMACLENSVRNLGIIMKEEWLPKLTDASEVEKGAGVVRQVALLLRSLPASIGSSCSLALSGVLQQAHEVLLLQAGVQTDLATWCAQELALSLALLPHRESRQALARKLLIEPALARI